MRAENTGTMAQEASDQHSPCLLGPLLSLM